MPTMFVSTAHGWKTLPFDLRARVENMFAEHGHDATYQNRGDGMRIGPLYRRLAECADAHAVAVARPACEIDRWHDTLMADTPQNQAQFPQQAGQKAGAGFPIARLVAVISFVLPRELSFKHTVQVWLAWSRKQFLSQVPEDLQALFRLIAHVRVGKRPGRTEPRAVKRRPKPFPRLQITRRRARRNIRLYGRPQRLRA